MTICSAVWIGCSLSTLALFVALFRMTSQPAEKATVAVYNALAATMRWWPAGLLPMVNDMHNYILHGGGRLVSAPLPNRKFKGKLNGKLLNSKLNVQLNDKS